MLSVARATFLGESQQTRSQLVLRDMTFDERLQYSTCRIESRFASGAVGVGTAFYYGYRPDPDRVIPMVVTNRHVIWDPQHGPALGGRFQVHTSKRKGDAVVPAGVFHHVEFDSARAPFHELWRGHSDPAIDLCAMMAMPLTFVMKGLGSEPYINAIGDSLELAPAQLAQLRVVEDVLMVGYPTGLWDDIHNFPLFRKGTTATHPAVDFQGRPIFVVDLACFPGSSGSPVFCMREGGYPGVDHKAGDDPRRFLGVLFEGPVLPGSGALVNLGYVIKAHKVRELAAQVWDHWSGLGYIPAPWSSDFDAQHLPLGALLPDENGVFREVHSPESQDGQG